MVAGFLVLGIAAGLVTGAGALLAGHAVWVAALAYMGGGMLGLGLTLVAIGTRCGQGLEGDA